MFERMTQGAVDVIHGESPLNVEYVEEVAKLLGECLEDGQPYVVLDFNGVPLIDSAGLELLLDYKTEFQQLGGGLKLAGASQLCEEILSVAGLSAGFEIYDDTLAAVGSYVR